jgi:N6-L-threonylcarbamoyladenine synthase
MASTLLPILSSPVSRATTFLLHRTRPTPFRSYCLLLRSLLDPASSPSTPPAPRSLVTMASARRDLLMLGIETSCDDTAAAVVGVARLLLPSFLPSHFYMWSNLLGFILSTSLLMMLGRLQVRGDGEILSQVIASQVRICVSVHVLSRWFMSNSTLLRNF